LRHWLTPASNALILDPTYGEYAHVLERVIGCTVDRLPLRRENGYALDIERFEAAVADNYDLIVLVNPNSPTGRHVPRSLLQRLLSQIPECTRVWVDETYVEYAGSNQSIERIAAESENVIVCKSMSKVYALSGARLAYLCAAPHQLESLRAITPPWVVSLPAQVAAVKALGDADYYPQHYAETSAFREILASDLRQLGLDVLPGIANFLLAHLPEDGPDAARVVQECRRHGLFLRDASVMGQRMGRHALRIAVKGKHTNRRIVEILASVLNR
jgi:histidinol-phosphate/aromatic aminotransferase/cobyric acid decarboxylase-like protein